MMPSIGSVTETSAPARTGQEYDMFLKLLTTQLKNQDPLDPMKTSEYTQQLVQFSQVEQAVQQTQTLGRIADQLAVADLTNAAGLIGRTVRIDSATAGLADGAPAVWDYRITGTAGQATATIRDARGRAMATVALDPQGGSLVWNGQGDRTAPAGAYTLEIAASDAQGAPLTSTITSRGQVQAISRTGNTTQMVVAGTGLPLDRLIGIGD